MVLYLAFLYLRFQEAKLTSGRGLGSRFRLVSRVRDFRVSGFRIEDSRWYNTKIGGLQKPSLLSVIVPTPG